MSLKLTESSESRLPASAIMTFHLTADTNFAFLRRITQRPHGLKGSEIFLARTFDVDFRRRTLGLVDFGGDSDRADGDRVVEFVSNPLHAGRSFAVRYPYGLRVVVESVAGVISCISQMKHGN